MNAPLSVSPKPAAYLTLFNVYTVHLFLLASATHHIWVKILEVASSAVFLSTGTNIPHTYSVSVLSLTLEACCSLQGNQYVAITLPCPSQCQPCGHLTITPFRAHATWESPCQSVGATLYLLRHSSPLLALSFSSKFHSLPLQLYLPLPALTTKDASPLRFGTFLSETSLNLLGLKLLSLWHIPPLLPTCLFQLLPEHSSPLLRSSLLNLHSFSIPSSVSGHLLASSTSELPALSVQYLPEPIGCEFPCLP